MIREKLLNLLYPPGLVCHACGRDIPPESGGLCEGCKKTLVRCAPLQAAQPLDGLYAAFSFEGSVREMIHRLKYDGGLYLAPWFADQITLPEFWQIDCIVPVPLHKRREHSRGYNQSAVLGAALAKKYGIPMTPELLVRVKNTPTQTNLSRTQRRKNIRGAFRAGGRPAGKSILLIDDVMTTGTTLSACAQTLKRAGANRVYAAAVCARLLD
jgi:ComF family protein